MSDQHEDKVASSTHSADDELPPRVHQANGFNGIDDSGKILSSASSTDSIIGKPAKHNCQQVKVENDKSARAAHDNAQFSEIFANRAAAGRNGSYSDELREDKRKGGSAEVTSSPLLAMNDSLPASSRSSSGRQSHGVGGNVADDDEEGPECRVCRGPAEVDAPLLHPCRCSGSIGLVHQPCLLSWLSSPTRPSVGEKCELCNTPFIFEPLYASGAPETLPWWEVSVGILHRLYQMWLPLTARLVLALVLWVGILPLSTGYLYHGWIHRPSSVLLRFKWELVPGDAVSGAVVASVIIVSFLGLMSLADFLRFRRNGDADVAPAVGDAVHDDDHEVGEDADGINNVEDSDEDGSDEEEELIGGDIVDEEAVMGGQLGGPRAVGNANEDGRAEPRLMRARNNAAAANHAPPAPFGEEEMEIHLALDELLGVRGPLLGLVRNLLWFLAFNTTYLGLFAFLPHAIGGSVWNVFLSGAKRLCNVDLSFRILPPAFVERLAFWRVPAVVRKCVDEIDSLVVLLNSEAETKNVILRLPDVTRIVLGYLALAVVVFVLQWIVALRTNRKSDNQHRNEFDYDVDHAAPQEGGANGLHHVDRDDAREGEDHLVNHPVEGGDAEERDAQEVMEEILLPDQDAPAEEQLEYISTKVGGLLDIAARIVKVGVLLFLKMILLPLFLGIGLDLATLPLFRNCTLHSRVEYAGDDLFGSSLLHWVVGISFMLVVTVSVLQLREVVHPDVFARVIRPQEPQPDLLGNLLREDGITHSNRMLVSLGIYVALLVVHVYLPTILLMRLGLGHYLPFSRVHFWHFLLPQLQVPVELLVFHLSMLAFLEKYKNCIGWMQHTWLRNMCRYMGLTEYILPQIVHAFILAGHSRIYLGSDEIDHKSLVDNEDESVVYAGSSERDEPTPTDGMKSSRSALVHHTEKTSCKENDEKRQRRKSADLVENSCECVSPNVSSSKSVISGKMTSPKRIDPFWRILADCKSPSLDFLMSNLEHISDSNEPIFERAVSRHSGERVLDNFEDVLRIPPDEIAGHSSKLLKCSIGPYRFRVRKDDDSSRGADDSPSLSTPSRHDDGQLKVPEERRSRGRGKRARKIKCLTDVDEIIEVWMEVAGRPIARPPEGWDDLDVGGAEAQGRWAWGDEKKSHIEESVAYRRNFNVRVLRLGLILRVMALLFASWVAVLIAICSTVSAPLIAGRAVLSILQVPHRFTHDPDAFALGVGLLVPLLGSICQAFVIFSKNDAVVALRPAGLAIVQRWIRRGVKRIPSLFSQKICLVSICVALWTLLLPLCVGLFYSMCFIKGRNWWAVTGASCWPTCMHEIAKIWGTGVLLTHGWAFMCFYSVFDKQFWISLGIAQEGDQALVRREQGDEFERREQADRDGLQQGEVDANVSLNFKGWQGENGRVDIFVRTLYAVCCQWEWDKVNRTALIDDSLKPVFHQLAMTLFGTLLLFCCQNFVFQHFQDRLVLFPVVGSLDIGLYRMLAFRISAGVVVVAQLVVSFWERLSEWFNAAHNAARDDRYLVGKTLKNFEIKN